MGEVLYIQKDVIDVVTKGRVVGDKVFERRRLSEKMFNIPLLVI